MIACTLSPATLSACTEHAVKEPAAVEVLVADTMKSYLGAWGETCPDGSAGVTTNDSDGTYAIAMADGMTSTGTWTLSEEQSCGTEEGAEQGNC